MMVNSSKLFVIGATGYIGGALLERGKKGRSVVGVSSSGINGLLTLRLGSASDFDYGKISDGDVVLLTAAISAPDICAREHDRAWTVNVTGTSDFIHSVLARGGRVVFFSSDTVYGERDYPFDERAECKPAGEYAQMKREVERHFAGDPLFKSIRLSYVFSNEDKFTRYLVGCAQHGEEADLFHPFFRSIVHRDDVIQGVLSLADHWDDIPDPIINFGGPAILSRVDFAECMQKNTLPNLRFRVTEPDDEFFKNRPRIIAMSSPILPSLLGRPAHTLAEAVQIEFGGERFK